MNLFRFFQPAASAPVARERLEILLEYERKLGSQIDLFRVLREEILAVVSRHVVDPEKVQVTIDRRAKFSTLAVDIEIPNTGGKALTLPTDCPVLYRDKTAGARGLSVNRGQMMPGVDAAAGTLAVPIWLAGAAAAPFVGAILPAAKRAGGVALITSLFCVGLIVAVVLGAWLYVQPPPRDPDAAEPASQSAVVAPPAALGNATSPPHEPPPLSDPDAAEPASQSGAVAPPAALGNATSPPQEPPLRGSVTAPSQEPPPLSDPDAAEPASQSAAVAPPAALGNATSPPHEPPLRGSVTAPSQEPPPLSDRDAAEPASQSAAVAPPAALGSAIPLPPRRPLQVRIAKRPRATAPPADAFVPM
jgi:cell division topological specificity factor